VAVNLDQTGDRNMISDREHSSPLSPEDLKEMVSYGITRVPVDYFHCGPFRYSNLKDAIAQAKRQQLSTSVVPQ
jgi:hypothetical protein